MLLVAQKLGCKMANLVLRGQSGSRVSRSSEKQEKGRWEPTGLSHTLNTFGTMERW